ncbi:low temperature requirement protein A [Streptomyces sp. NBC_01497]|uniref:low temperature requirement protein A n=1 Tax=Streptomyces sp. NBC_01497 TaxID=2903885 RepID=UPI002E32E985|nr:low temperature requirement protein A [Streptomyces sp. NBC_01497]
MSQPQDSTGGWVWYRPMTARPADEENRTSTALELFFDLCFVIAVARSAAAFEHEFVAGHIAHGVLGYVLVFFAIWWAWMNFTWFSSAYDTDDVFYRLLTLVQITGALIMAAGAGKALEHYDFTVVTIGYVVMRLAMMSQWLRAAYSDPERRRGCVRYAAGIFVLQVGWVARLAAGGHGSLVTFLVLVAGELAVPLWAERAAQTTWHPRHVAERFGLFTLIVLGETVTAVTDAVSTALDLHIAFGDIASLVIGGIMTVFAMWWLYFAYDAPTGLISLSASLRWGYGHYALFAAAAAVGAGLAANISESAGHVHRGHTTMGAVYTVPVAVYVAALRLLLRHQSASGALDVLFAAAVIAVLASTFASSPVLVTGCVVSALVAATLVIVSRTQRRMPRNASRRGAS